MQRQCPLAAYLPCCAPLWAEEAAIYCPLECVPLAIVAHLHLSQHTAHSMQHACKPPCQQHICMRLESSVRASVQQRMASQCWAAAFAFKPCIKAIQMRWCAGRSTCTKPMQVLDGCRHSKIANATQQHTECRLQTPQRLPGCSNIVCHNHACQQCTAIRFACQRCTTVTA